MLKIGDRVSSVRFPDMRGVIVADGPDGYTPRGFVVRWEGWAQAYPCSLGDLVVIADTQRGEQ